MNSDHAAEASLSTELAEPPTSAIWAVRITAALSVDLSSAGLLWDLAATLSAAIDVEVLDEIPLQALWD